MNKGNEGKMLYYNGQEYEELGVDPNGKHRLYNHKTKSYMLLPDS